MDDESRLISEIVDEIYAAALDAERWPTTLARMAGAFGGLQATLYSHDIHRRSADVHAHWGLDPGFLKSYTDDFAHLNPFVDPVARLPVGGSATADDLIDRDIYRNGTFYNEWVRPQDGGEFITTKLSADVTSLSGVTVLRGARAFGAGERALWSSLVTHIRRALQVHRELSTVRFARDGAVEALDSLSVGIVLAGAGGSVLFANAAAERALRTGRGVRASGGRLSGETAGATEALARAVDAAIATGGGRGASSGGVLALPSRSGAAVPVLVSPLPGSRSALGAAGRAALVMIGGRRRVRVAPVELTRAFGLTPAEAHLLSALVGGRSLGGYAGDNAIALETARAHLRKVLAKTGAARQADAIRLVLSDAVLARSSEDRPPSDDGATPERY